MFNPENFKSELFFTTEENFEQKALDLFSYQWESNKVYRSFCQNLSKSPDNVSSLQEIPFLPIEFFKTHQVKTGNWKTGKKFLSSGTTSSQRSCHEVKDVTFYHKAARQAFEMHYGSLEGYTIIALLPSYLEQGQSSLISMVDHFVSISQPESVFVKTTEELKEAFEKASGKVLILGVTYALMDLAESKDLPDLSGAIIMETGGMKGRRKEITRLELHKILKDAFKVPAIHSEYGMTELLSQAYGQNGLFSFAYWTKCILRDINDPLSSVKPGKTGGINIIDLANIYSCAFVETKDLGRSQKNGFFEVMGRFDNSDIRGCNLLI